MQVRSISALVFEPSLGEMRLDVAYVGSFRKEGIRIAGRDDGELAAVLAVPASTPNEAAEEHLVEALRVVAQALVALAATSGTFLVDRRRQSRATH